MSSGVPSSVGPLGVQVELVAVGSRMHVDVIVLPGIPGDELLVQVGSGPQVGSVGALDQRPQPLLRGGQAAHVGGVGHEGRLQLLDLRLGGIDLALGQPIPHRRADNADDQAQDDGHHHEFDQAEAPRMTTALGVCLVVLHIRSYIGISLMLKIE